MDLHTIQTEYVRKKGVLFFTWKYGDINCNGEDYGRDRFYKEYQKLHFEYVKFEMLIKYSSGNIR